MITQKQAITQALRLRALPGKREEGDLVEERLAAVSDKLRKISRDAAHANAIVTQCIQYCKFVPTPVEVEEVAEEMARDSSAAQDWKPGNERTIHHVRSDTEFWLDIHKRPRAGLTSEEAADRLAALEQEAQGLLASIGGKR